MSTVNIASRLAGEPRQLNNVRNQALDTLLSEEKIAITFERFIRMYPTEPVGLTPRCQKASQSAPRDFS
jgi:hypothetical protein